MPFYSVSIGVDYVKSEYFKHTLFSPDEENLDQLVASMSIEDIIERGRVDGSTEGGYTDDNTRVADADVMKRVPRALIGLPVTCTSKACSKHGTIIAVDYFDGAGEETLTQFIASWRALDDSPAICAECHRPGQISNPLADNAKANPCSCAHKVNAPDCKVLNCDGHDPTCTARQPSSEVPRDTQHAATL